MAGPNPTPARHYLERLTHYLREGLEERLAAYDRSGHSLHEIGPAEDIARRMLQSVPEPSRWDDLLGPFYTTRQISELFGGISRQAVADRRQRRTLLGLRTADGVVVFPTFQLDDEQRVLEGLPAVLRCFPADLVDEWTLAGWLVAPQHSLGRRSPIDWLRRGEDPEPVIALARDTARRFAQ
ncbi:MAG: hypothetical protein AAF604_18165 [Acidobacteriota bacterium]